MSTIRPIGPSIAEIVVEGSGIESSDLAKLKANLCEFQVVRIPGWRME